MVGKVARDGNIYRAFKDTLGKTLQVEGAGRPLEREGGGWALGADRGPAGSGGRAGWGLWLGERWVQPGQSLLAPGEWPLLP